MSTDQLRRAAGIIPLRLAMQSERVSLGRLLRLLARDYAAAPHVIGAERCRKTIGTATRTDTRDCVRCLVDDFAAALLGEEPQA